MRRWARRASICMRSVSSTPDWRPRLRSFPYLLIFGTGIALNNTKAILEALCHMQGTFVRTPKFGIARPTDTWVGTRDRVAFSWLSLGELVLAVYSGYGVYLAIHQEGYLLLPFLLLYTLGFAAVGGAESRRELPDRRSPSASTDVSASGSRDAQVRQSPPWHDPARHATVSLLDIAGSRTPVTPEGCLRRAIARRQGPDR